MAIYGSPRRKGNTAALLKKAIEGARDCGADVEEIVLRDLKISPCLEIYGCMQAGECAIKDDFQMVRDKILHAQGLILASPVFFYSVSSHTKILMDRFQSLLVKKYWVEKTPQGSISRTSKKYLTLKSIPSKSFLPLVAPTDINSPLRLFVFWPWGVLSTQYFLTHRD